MIETNQLDAIIKSLQEQFEDFDEHVIRLHLMAYSVKKLIDRMNARYDPNKLDSEENALYESDLNSISRGYYGLLRNDILSLMEEKDPFGINNLLDSKIEDLHNLLRFQVGVFQGKPREPIYYDEYDGLKQLLNGLSVLDRDAIYPLTPETISKNPFDLNNMDSSINCIHIPIDEEVFVMDLSSLSIDTYKRYSDYLITEFYKASQFLNPDEILTQVVDGMQLQDAVSIKCINIGSGNGLWTLKKKFPDADLKEIVIKSRNICESFLCAVNLYPLEWYLREPYINLDNPFKEREKVVVEKRQTDAYDLILGVISEHEFLEDSLNPDIFKISHESIEVESQYIELIIAKLSEAGQAFIAVPERYLYSTPSRQNREFFFNKIRNVEEVSLENTGNSFGKMVIVHFDRSLPLPERQGIEFRSGSEKIDLTIDEIRENNPQLDLRPSRFLNSIEYEYRDILELFDKDILDKKLKVDLLTILSSLKDGTDFKNNFNSSRKILEAFYGKLISTENLSSKEFELLSDQQGRIKLENCWRFFSGMDVKRNKDKNDPTPLKRQGCERFPSYVKDCSKTAQNLTNKNSHYYKEDSSIYEYRTAVNALLVTLDWLLRKQTECEMPDN